jgi:hypothetical protein
MSIRPPRLDDRAYEDLVSELVARIPAHTPEWTNPRPGDPGRTLIELFSWLGDALLYRANLIPERQRLAFLRLLGMPLQPARPARGMVTLALRENEPVAAYQVRPVATVNGPVLFEVRDEFTVMPVTAAAYYKRKSAPEDLPPELRLALSEFHANGGAIQTYYTTPVFAAGQPLAAGLDIVADSADRCLWIALFAPAARPPAQQPAMNVEVRRSMGGGLLNVGFVPGMASADPLEPVTARLRVPHVWEITANTTGDTPTDQQPWRPEFLALEEIFDSTAGLRKPGIVRLELPRDDQIHGPSNDVRLDPDAGVGDRPPRLDDEALAARLVAWIRLRPAPPVDPPVRETRFNTGQGAPSLQLSQLGAVATPREVEHLRVVWTGVNAVEIEQLVTYSNLIVGESSGAADQEFQLPATSIEAETLMLDVEEDGQWITWTRVDDLATLDPEFDPQLTLDGARDARAYQLDAAGGVVTFGDGVRGRVPPAGRRIRARQLRTGGGTVGNLPPGSLKTIAANTLTGESIGNRLAVTQTMALGGSTDAETLRDAERRIPARLRHRERAVTTDDYRVLARQTPGVDVGRVEVLPRFKPQTRHSDIPGVVTVMALPDREIGAAPNPRADRPFLEAVHQFLDKRRPVATELYVIGCEYVPVALSVALTVAEGAPPDVTLHGVRDAMRRVLWPLSGGGFGQEGWPLGRALSNRELAAEVARVAGVSEVAGLNLFRRNPSSGQWEPLGDSRTGQEQNLALEKWQLPELLAVAIVADDAATGASLTLGTVGAGGIANGAPLSITDGTLNPFADPNAVPLAVPVVPDLC